LADSFPGTTREGIDQAINEERLADYLRDSTQGDERALDYGIEQFGMKMARTHEGPAATQAAIEQVLHEKGEVKPEKLSPDERLDALYKEFGNDAVEDALSQYWQEMRESPATKTVSAEKIAGTDYITQEQAQQRLEDWKRQLDQIGKERRSENGNKIILSLFDRTGKWAEPFLRAGYDVRAIDLVIDNVDVMDINREWLTDYDMTDIHGILSANPCDDFAASGARWWKEKDAKGKTEASVKLAKHTMAIIDYLMPNFWALENPVGRLQTLVPEVGKPALQFHPHNYGDPYTKRTQIFGNFNPDLPLANVEPTEGSRMHKLRGDVPEEKLARSETPEGFANAFAVANAEHGPAERVRQIISEQSKEKGTRAEAAPKTEPSATTEPTTGIPERPSREEIGGRAAQPTTAAPESKGFVEAFQTMKGAVSDSYVDHIWDKVQKDEPIQRIAPLENKLREAQKAGELQSREDVADIVNNFYKEPQPRPEPDLSSLSATKLRALGDKRQDVVQRLTDQLIDEGYGRERFSETKARADKGDPLAKEFVEAMRRAGDVSDELRRRKEYHGSDKPIKKPTVPTLGGPDIVQAGQKLRLKAQRNGGFFLQADMADLRDFGQRVYQKGMDFTQWGREMIGHLGREIVRHLGNIWRTVTGRDILPHARERMRIAGGAGPKMGEQIIRPEVPGYERRESGLYVPNKAVIDRPDLRVSTRFPTSMTRLEGAAGPLSLDMKAILADKGWVQRAAAELDQIIPRKLVSDNPAQTIENAIEFFKRNKVAHYKLVREYPWADHAMRQYEGYNIYAHHLARKYGIPVERILAAESKMSPSVSPDLSFAYTERIAQIMSQASDHKWDARMTKAAQEFKLPPEDLAKLKGRRYSDLGKDADLKARWIRAFDEAHNRRPFFEIIRPDGTLGDVARNVPKRPGELGEPSKFSWGLYDNIASGIKALEGEPIHELFNSHKTPSYLNAKANPNGLLDWVSDRHDLSSSFFHSIGLKKLKVGEKPTPEMRLAARHFGGLASAQTGIKGLYPLHAEAGRRAAAEVGLPSNAMQALTWAGQREQFSPRWFGRKTIDKIHASYEAMQRGKISEEQHRNNVIDIARSEKGVPSAPAITLDPRAPSRAINVGAEYPALPGELSEAGGLRRAPGGPAAPRGGGGISGGIPAAREGSLSQRARTLSREARNREGGYTTLIDDAIDFGRALYGKGKDYARWAKEMVGHLGEAIREHLGTIWRSVTGQDFLPQARERGAIGYTGGPKSRLERLSEDVTSKLKNQPKAPVIDKVNESIKAAKEAAKTAPKTGPTAMQRLGDNAKAALMAVRDAYMRPPEQSDFKTALKNWLFAHQKISHEVRTWTDQLRKAMPDKLAREAITNYIQADGNLNTLEQRAAASTGRNLKHQAGYIRAQHLTDAEKEVANSVRDYFDAQLKEGQKQGILNGAVENYITQIWKKENPFTKDLMADLQRGRLQRNFNYARKRMFDSFFEGEQAGRAPASKDFTSLIGAYDQAFNRTLAARGFINELRNAKTAGGEPVARFSGYTRKVPGGDLPADAYLVRSKALPKAAETAEGKPYQSVNHPAMRGWKLVTQEGEGPPVYHETDMLVHPEHAQHLRNVLQQSPIRQNPVGRFFLKGGAIAKQTRLSLSPFHLTQEATHALFHRVNPARIVKIDFNDPAQARLIHGGLQVADYDAMELFSEGLKGGGLTAKIPGVGKVQNFFNDWLFKDYIPRLKMTMALDAYERNAKRYPNLSEAQLAELTANQSNAAFGELNYKMMGRSPIVQDALRLSLLAPDFLEARGRFVGQALKPYGREQQVALALGMAGMYVTARALNQALDGKPHWDKPFSIFHGGREYRMRTVFGDAYEAFTDPRRFVQNRLSPVTRTIETLRSGRDYRGEKLTLGGQAKDFLSWFIPIPLEERGVTHPREWMQTAPQRFLASAGLPSKPEETPDYLAMQSARRFKQGLPDPKVRAELERRAAETYVTPDYARLNRALLDNDKEKAIEEMIRLMKEKGKTPMDLGKYYTQLPMSPYTGNRMIEMQWLTQMNPGERAMYDRAIQQRMQMSQRFAQLISYALQQTYPQRSK